MSRVQDAVTTKRREEILAAAMVCFGEKGFVATKMTDIAARVPMSVGNLYNYFKNKDALVETLADREVSRLVEKIQRSEEHGSDPEHRIRELKELALSRLSIKSATFAMDVMKEALKNPRLASILHRFDQSCREVLLAAYIRCGAKDPERRLELDMCLINGLTIRILANPTLDAQRLAESVARRIVNA